MKRILQQFFQREAHPVVQFIKYGIAGGLATAVDVLVFYFLSWKVFPALTANDAVVKLLGISVAMIDEFIRSRHYLLNKTITFLFSNLTAYIVNILWVFEPGRHKKWMEFALFYTVSIVSFSARHVSRLVRHQVFRNDHDGGIRGEHVCLADDQLCVPEILGVQGMNTAQRRAHGYRMIPFVGDILNVDPPVMTTIVPGLERGAENEDPPWC